MPNNNLSIQETGLCALNIGYFDPQDPYNPNNCNPLYSTIEGRSPIPGFATPGFSVPGVYYDRGAIPGYAIPAQVIPGMPHTVELNPAFNYRDQGYSYLTKSPMLIDK